MADFTITVTVDTTTNPHTLEYTGSLPPTGGATNGATSHHVFNGSDLYFICPDGDLLIQFTNRASKNQRPFTNAGVNAIVQAPKGVKTPKLTLKNNTPDTIKYTAVVARAGTPHMVWEDPELEVGPHAGGPPVKKAAGKKKKTK